LEEWRRGELFLPKDKIKITHKYTKDDSKEQCRKLALVDSNSNKAIRKQKQWLHL
jgi:hypothetical protein